MVQYFENLEAGQVHEFGTKTVSREEIVDFAEQYDPQPFHLDGSEDEMGMFDGLIASGWHAVCLATRMIVDELITDVANMGGRGADDVRWHRPVRPGDTLSGAIEVHETAATHPERGGVAFRVTCRNQRDETVLTMTLHLIIRRRDPANGD